MAKPRRALKRTWWPKWLRVTTYSLIAALIALVTVYYLTLPQKVETVIVPMAQPQPTWTSYVPQMPSQCMVMLDKADDLYDLSVQSEKEILDVAVLAVDGAQEMSSRKLIEAGRAAERAERWTPKLQKARETFLAEYRKCADA